MFYLKRRLIVISAGGGYSQLCVWGLLPDLLVDQDSAEIQNQHVNLRDLFFSNLNATTLNHVTMMYLKKSNLMSESSVANFFKIILI